MKNIEVEVRSFLTKEKYEELLSWFQKNATFVNEDYQITYYFDSKEDLRIQQNKFFSKVWLKKGKIHDDQREEIEVRVDRDKFEELEKLFLFLGYNIDIKWLRKRYSFKWKGVNVAVDFTKGYGYILEMDKMACEGDKETVLQELQERMKELSIEITPKEEFREKYEFYKENWKKLI